MIRSARAGSQPVDEVRGVSIFRRMPRGPERSGHQAALQNRGV